jgi:uncharacterized protein with HEPN domain
LSGEAIYLRHILAAITRIEEYIRQLEIVGEAVKGLSPETRASRPGVPWKDIAGMRDFLTHDYLGVDLRTVWETSQRDVPALRHAVEELLAES